MADYPGSESTMSALHSGGPSSIVVAGHRGGLSGYFAAHVYTIQKSYTSTEDTAILWESPSRLRS